MLCGKIILMKETVFRCYWFSESRDILVYLQTTAGTNLYRLNETQRRLFLIFVNKSIADHFVDLDYEDSEKYRVFIEDLLKIN
jgi:hypothetical protein